MIEYICTYIYIYVIVYNHKELKQHQIVLQVIHLNRQIWFLKVKEYNKGTNKDYIPLEKTEHTRKKTFVYDFNGNVTKILGDYL